MDWERFLIVSSGVSITLALAGQLRYEGLHQLPRSISPFAAIGLFAAVASLLIWGIIAHSGTLSIACSIGTVMSLVLIRTSLRKKGNIKRNNRL